MFNNGDDINLEKPYEIAILRQKTFDFCNSNIYTCPIDWLVVYKYSEKGADELNIAERVEFYEQELIEHRRWLHRHAELAWKEFETTEYIENYLKELGLEPLHLGDMTGCYAYIQGGQAGPDAKTILLRADIDAMEGQDKKDVP